MGREVLTTGYDDDPWGKREEEREWRAAGHPILPIPIGDGVGPTYPRFHESRSPAKPSESPNSPPPPAAPAQQ